MRAGPAAGTLSRVQLPGARIHLVTPAPPGSALGNRVTAERWAGLWRASGADVAVSTGWDGAPAGALVALHATKSLASIERWLAARPAAPLVVALAGTDVHGELADLPRARAALARAARIVALEASAAALLPEDLRPRARVIEQSAAPAAPLAPSTDRFEVLVLAHLRRIKDPLLPAAAARRLPAESRVRVLHAGAALEPDLAAAAAREALENPRYRWLGLVGHAAARELLARAHVLVLPSRQESGANALVEALSSGVPVLATDVPGTASLLGGDHPGLFPAGDAAALAALLLRAERDAAFLDELRARSRGLAPRFAPERERADWERLFAELPAPA